MKLTDLIIAPSSLGNKLWLVDVTPAYAYVNRQRTDNITGYRYSVALPEKNLDKIVIKIEGEQRMEAPNGYVEVRFDNLELYLQWYRGDYMVTGRATGIHEVPTKA